MLHVNVSGLHVRHHSRNRPRIQHWGRQVRLQDTLQRLQDNQPRGTLIINIGVV